MRKTFIKYLYVYLFDKLKQYLTGTVDGMEISQGFLFGAAVFLESWK